MTSETETSSRVISEFRLLEKWAGLSAGSTCWYNPISRDFWIYSIAGDKMHQVHDSEGIAVLFKVLAFEVGIIPEIPVEWEPYTNGVEAPRFKKIQNITLDQLIQILLPYQI